MKDCTRYTMVAIDADTRERVNLALFSSSLPHEMLADIARAAWENIVGAADLFISDMDTGEVIWSAVLDYDREDEDWGYNEDMGFDPYLGSYTDDC